MDEVDRKARYECVVDIAIRHFPYGNKDENTAVINVISMKPFEQRRNACN